MKIVYVLFGILVILSLPRLVIVALARIAGTMAAARGAHPSVLDSLEPRVNFWSGGLTLWMLALWTSYVAYLVFEVAFIRWISVIFAALSMVTFIMFVLDIRKRI